MSFSENVKKLRKNAALTQTELADKVKISQPTLAQYERGIRLPTIIVAVDLAKALNTTCEELVK